MLSIEHSTAWFQNKFELCDENIINVSQVVHQETPTQIQVAPEWFHNDSRKPQPIFSNSTDPLLLAYTALITLSWKKKKKLDFNEPLFQEVNDVKANIEWMKKKRDKKLFVALRIIN